ncbi:unnamed protein product [Bursaphelenchus okinawaensis]|uniref:G_PROTEIN_RECEP_F1_2 domain-containing protein n=1 Tax=Bursaphelenchus okinawaensis TaxID=465554 RepID=A0A811JRR8_9BILA|nr:unnamed protein product [Bursaphelenchus okinawaensis]CAG9080115.1 unnamed protein product [Bursaphelenchus okinawaensis]
MLDFLQISGSLALFVTVVSHGMLLYLLINKTPSRMKHYTRLLYVHLANDFVFSMAFYLVLPHIFPLQGQLFIVSSNIAELLGYDANLWLTTMYFYCEVLQLLLLPLDFYYRYRVVCKEDIMSTKKLFTIITVMLLWVSMQSTVMCHLLGHSENDKKLLMEAISFDELPIFVATQNPLVTYINQVMTQSGVISCFAMCAYAFRRINAVLRRNLDTNKKNKTNKIERQITRLMIVQSVIPAILVSLPLLATSICTQLQITLTILGPINQILISWNGALKTIATILVVPNYRNFILTKVGRRKSVTTIVTQLSTSRTV